MKKYFSQFFAIYLLFFSELFAKESDKFPNFSGNVLMQFQADRILSTNKEGISANNAFIYVEPNISLNLNSNWSIKTDWRIQPNNVLTTRNNQFPERYRTFLQKDRGLNLQDTGLLIEELKLHFENDDIKFFAGKFDPSFGVAHNKAKRIGVFTSQFTEDYNLREKLGAGITALLENNEITLNTFFNDTTSLSQSGLNKRGQATKKSGIAGNAGVLSSYSFSINGENFFGFEDWIYNVGYRNLGVGKTDISAREKGYVFGSEYLYKIGARSSVIPFFEAVKIDNFAGQKGRNGIYTTTALIGRYINWTSSISLLNRNINASQTTSKSTGRQVQISFGYKFPNNVTIDFSRSSLTEDGHKAALVGFLMGYFYKF
jgi:hypothetical protein